MKTVSADQISDLLVDAAQRRVPVTLTLQHQNRWVVFHTHALAVQGDKFWVDMPAQTDGLEPAQCLPGKPLGLSFVFSQHSRFLASTTVTVGKTRTVGGAQVIALAMEFPEEMRELERRTYLRVEIPSHHRVLAEIWPGGASARPEHESPTQPIWRGRVFDMSLGGVQIQTTSSALRFFQPGDIVGMQIHFEKPGETIATDAHFRAGENIGVDHAMLGFQFTSLDSPEQGDSFMASLAGKIEQYDGEF